MNEEEENKSGGRDIKIRKQNACDELIESEVNFPDQVLDHSIGVKEQYLKRVRIEAVEFDWCFFHEECDKLIDKLAETDNDDIFLKKSIKTFIWFHWQKYKPIIYMALFVPYMIYIVTWCVYVTYAYEND